MNESEPRRYLDAAPGVRLAYVDRGGRDPAVVFLPGFNSVMTGRKASYLDGLCARLGHRCVRFDYRGHGESSGRIEDGGVDQWRQDAQAVIAHCRLTDVVLVGASMGGWIMLLLARSLGRRVKGVVGIAAAADFTRSVVARLSPDQREELARDGITYRPSRYGDGPYPLTRRMLEEGERNRVLGSGLDLRCPLHLFHGLDDPDLPWQTGLDILGGLDAAEARLTLIAGGDHRLSREPDLTEVGAAVARLLREAQ
jgi:pimeloyl-ACP methyl ester carboxylesterase